MRRLYSCGEVLPQGELPYTARWVRPLPWRAWPGQGKGLRTLAVNLYWYAVTLGKYRVFCVYDGSHPIHTSYVVPKCGKFPFLKTGEVEIGPCHTEAAYRGQGIYPWALSRILRQRRRAYLIIDDSNAASIRGAAKAGFTLLPGAVHADRWKRHIYIP